MTEPERSLPRARWRGRSRLVRLARLWRTRRPRRFTEKVCYKMLRDRRELLVTFADKAAVRGHVIQAGYGHLLPEALAVLDDADALLALDLPESYVVKPTHGSGAAIVVSPAAPVDATLPRPEWGWVYAHVRPEAVERGALRDIADRWCEQLYGRGPNEEWAYSRIRPRIIVEERLVGADGGIPDDCKLFVFHGRVRYVEMDSGRFGTRTQDFFDVDWQHLPLSGGPAWADPPHPRPDRLDEMITIAERLGADTDFVRVDLYLLPDRIVFGELTSYPAGGHSPFDPDAYDVEFGSHWTVPRRYR
ncbi:ATP-grasp fold amidoligase family protein [Agrococcus jejuensis]|uniref:ATP-grasp fold amidoligase family protein n=1 Tax=Agrococcus jejuensis TaxID=399736 RepID=UPI00119E9EEE|nr:ATP-grasp fold amidoligase family protein [Agrococcus jejuensis]